MTSHKQELVQCAKLAEKAERYDEMAQFIKKAVELDPALSEEEHHLFWSAYKNAVGARRSSLRIILTIEQEVEGSAKKAIEKGYRENVEHELRGMCNEVLGLLDTVLVPKAGNGEMKVCYLKMKGDYLRYLAEISNGKERNDVVEKSKQAYQEAYDIAKDTMQASHPLRLGVAVNFSVLFYEFLGTPDRAYQLTKQAFGSAISEMGALNKDSYKAGALHDVMQRIRENLSLWSPDGAVCQHSVPVDVDIDEHLADGIRALVVTKLQAAEPDGLNLKQLIGRFTQADPAIGDLFNNDEAILRKFLVEKCSDCVDVVTLSGAVYAFYKQPSS